MSEYPDLDPALAEACTRAKEVGAALSNVTGTGDSPGAITATVDAQGRLKDIRISQSARQEITFRLAPPC